jgi:diadenosine tetraphosphate (Ap4A) HIT family hydrolase
MDWAQADETIVEKRMETSTCPFCHIPQDQRFYDGPLVFGIWDSHPVSPGHALLIPRRHVATWFDASLEEKAELLAAVDAARAAIERTNSPDGYNIGVNVGAAAGQTVFHLHVHVIPRYKGDVKEPRGGVLHVLPGKGREIW